MPPPLAHLYDLALRALDDQERRASELRGRVGPVLAAGGVGTTLLAGPAFSIHPRSVVEFLAAIVGVTALLAVAGAAGYVLRAHSVDTDIDVMASVEVLKLRDALEDLDRFYSQMIAMLYPRQLQNRVIIRRLQTAFTVILGGILLELCSFAVVAVVG